MRAAETPERAQWQDEHRRHQSGTHDCDATATAIFAYTGAGEIEKVVREIFGAACLLLVQRSAPRPPKTAARITKNGLHGKQTIRSRYSNSTARNILARLQIRSGKPRLSMRQRLDHKKPHCAASARFCTTQEPLFTLHRTIKDQNVLLTHSARPLALLPLLARGPCVLRHQHKRRGRQRQGEVRARA